MTSHNLLPTTLDRHAFYKKYVVTYTLTSLLTPVTSILDDPYADQI